MHEARACQFLKDFFTLLHCRAKGKNQLTIKHEFIKAAKTTVARFVKLKFRVQSLRGSNTMLSLPINEFFSRICWDLSSCSSFPALVKRTSHLFSRFNFSRKNIQGLANAGDIDGSEKKN